MKSTLVKNQEITKTTRAPHLWLEGQTQRLTVSIRYDDRCNNGHNTFSITGDQGGNNGIGGCIHDHIIEHMPELEPLIKWHLCSSDMPMHYIANTLYHARRVDCWGLEKGEFKQHTSRGEHQNEGVEGVPCWELKGIKGKEVYSDTKPESETVTLEWEPRGMTGEGSEPDLEAARRSAIWPDATLEQLTDVVALGEHLKEMRVEFKAMILSLGMEY